MRSVIITFLSSAESNHTHTHTHTHSHARSHAHALTRTLTCTHTPPPLQQVFERLGNLLAPGGSLLFRDYGRYDLAQVWRRSSGFVFLYLFLCVCHPILSSPIVPPPALSATGPQLRFKKGRKIDDNFYVRQDGTRSYYFTREEIASYAEGRFFFSLVCGPTQPKRQTTLVSLKRPSHRHPSPSTPLARSPPPPPSLSHVPDSQRRASRWKATCTTPR